MKVAGLKNIQAQSVDFVLTPPNGISGAASTSSKVGPAARIMKHFDGTSSDASAIEEAERRCRAGSGSPEFVHMFNIGKQIFQSLQVD
jgi:hypothetical protein